MTDGRSAGHFKGLVVAVFIGFLVLVALGIVYGIYDYARQPVKHMREVLRALQATAPIERGWFSARADLELEDRPATLEAGTISVQLTVIPNVHIPERVSVGPVEKTAILEDTVALPDSRFTRDLRAGGPEGDALGVLSKELRETLVRCRLALWPGPWLGIKDGALFVLLESYDLARIRLVRPYVRDAVAALEKLPGARTERLLGRLASPEEPIEYRVRALKVLLRDFADTPAAERAAEIATKSKHVELRDAVTPPEEHAGRLALAVDDGEAGTLAMANSPGGLSETTDEAAGRVSPQDD